MLPQNYAIARARFVILLILVLTYTTDAASGDSPISSSSDAWAGLVANVAPLLVLVGEKHVKAYFKIMFEPSHHLLFASAPIGFVTVLTTLIRLDGSLLLKRLIGRQFETRAEVLADVTSISGGEVGLELRNMRLEQTIQPTDEDLAMFWVHGGTKGSPEEVAMTFSVWTGILTEIHEAVTKSPSFYYDRRFSWEIIMSFKATGTCAKWVARKHAAKLCNLPELLDRCEKVIAEEGSGSVATCAASAAVYARFTDVSLDITAGINNGKGKLETLRYAAIVLCLIANIGIIIAGKFAGIAWVEVGSVSAGLVSCAYGSWETARVVDLASKEIIIDMSGLSAIASGFFSHRTPEGTKLSSFPKGIAFSSTSPHGSRLGNYLRVGPEPLTVALTFIMVVSYLALYLGLRACSWWVSIAILGNSAIAAIGRSILVPTDMYLVSAESRLPNPMTCRIGDPTNREDLSHPNESNDPPDINAGPTPLDVGLYEAIVCKYRYEGGSRSVYDKMQLYLWTAFALATEMSKRRIAPLEMRDFPPRSFRVVDTEGTACIFSDIITRKGVWRQPLEVIVHRGQYVPERILAVFWGWYWRASAHQAQKVASIELPPDLVNDFIDLGDDDEAKFDTPTDKLKAVLSSSGTPREILWMGAKLCYASFHHWEWNMFEAERDSWFPGARYGYFEQGQISPFLDAIVAAGLTSPRG